MKFEEKMKKNKNCEISHIVRPEVTPEVYKPKQKTLFISECMEHRRFKMTWALWLYSDECTIECSGICTVRYAWLGQAPDSVVRGAQHVLVGRFGRDAWLGYSLCTARLVVVHCLVGTRPRLGRDAPIGCTRAKLYGYD